MRKQRPPNVRASEEWQVVIQIVLPNCCRNEVMSLAHESPMAGHLGVYKTYKTRAGDQYLLTIMCKATRFPKAVLLSNVKAPKIIDSLIKFFTFVGLPRSVQSDQGSNFMSYVMQQTMYQLGIQRFKSSAYHPQSQGALECFDQTLKKMIELIAWSITLTGTKAYISFCFQLEKLLRNHWGSVFLNSSSVNCLRATKVL